MLCSWNDLRKELLTTMAITTKMTETQAGITYGYSDTCDTLFANGDWTASELARFSWCRWQDRYTNCLSATTIDTGSWQGAAVCNVLSYFQNNGGDLKTKYVDDLIPTHEPYAFNILMYGRNDDLCLNSSNASNYKVVTSCSDFQKLYVQVDEYKSQDGTRNVQHPTARTIDINRLLWSSGGVYNSDTGMYTNFITVWTVFVLDENTFFVTRGMGFPNRDPSIYDGSFGTAQLNFRPSNSLDLDNTPTDDKWQYSSTQITTYDETKYLLRWYKNGLTGIEEDIWTAQDQYGCWDVDSDVSVIMHGSWGNYQYTYALRTENAVKNAIAYTGLRWKYRIGDTEHIYTPIIDGDGYITGWSTDPDVETKLNDIVDVTGNNISPTPPAPPTPPVDPWDVDPETYGWSGGEVSGMVKYYLLTSGEMSSLQSAIASNANWTIDYLNCIVSCFVVPNSGIFFDAPIPTTVKFKLDNATEWDTGVACKRIQGTKNKNGGTIEIPRLTNTFYDFEPYSDYSVYIPFCGRIPIKGNICLGREIKVTYYPDVPTCSLTAVVSCGGATIAIAKGSFGTMTPVTSNGSDRKTAAVIGDVAPIITGIGTGIVGVALGNPLIVGAGAAQALGGIMGGVKETVQSYAYSVGSTGDSSFFGAGNRCYYYANYPVIDDVVNNSMFGHSVGYLCNTVGKLSEFHGFTICANPHVTFSATAEEREEIERLLSMGVIL